MRRVLVMLALGLCATTLLAETWANRHDTLARNGRWISGKVGLARGVMGAVAFMTTRRPLSRNRLDLGSYFGFQEVLYSEPLDLAEIAFDFELIHGAALTFLYGGDDGAFDAIRLSDASVAGLRITPEGGFAAREPIVAAALGPGRHRLRVVFERDRVAVALDDVPLPARPPVRASPQRFGFRSGAAHAFVDDIAIVTRDGRRVFESFHDWRDFALAWLAIGGLLTMAATAALLFARRRAHAPVLVTGVALLGAALVLYLVDYYRLSARYPPPEHIDYQGYATNIETEEEVVAGVQTRYGTAPRADVARLLFLGTSQTWGAGAARLEDVFSARIAAQLGTSYQVINVGISGSDSTRLLALYRERWLALAPRAVVVDLGNNDPSPSVLTANLRALVALDRAHDIRTLLVVEPNAPEAHVDHDASWNAMRAVARELGVPLVDLHAELARRADSGFLFWDLVHLTSYGQRLAAEILYPAIAELLRRQ